MRIGQGFDVHAFGPGDYVTLAGVRVPFECGLVAHSDGDVVIHALCDAILGALALGDIGKHFPPSEERWRGADSRQFLLHCAALMLEQGYTLANADITVIGERPKISPHAHVMRENLASDLGCPIGDVSLKATTTEKLGFCGRGEGLAAQAVVLLVRLQTPTGVEPTAGPEVRELIARMDIDGSAEVATPTLPESRALDER